MIEPNNHNKLRMNNEIRAAQKRFAGILESEFARATDIIDRMKGDGEITEHERRTAWRMLANAMRLKVEQCERIGVSNAT